MSILGIMQWIILPVLGWLLVNSNKNQRRLTRIETKLGDFIEETRRYRCNYNEKN